MTTRMKRAGKTLKLESLISMGDGRDDESNMFLVGCRMEDRPGMTIGNDESRRPRDAIDREKRRMLITDDAWRKLDDGLTLLTATTILLTRMARSLVDILHNKAPLIDVLSTLPCLVARVTQ
jgi:hypothetical protein